MSRSTFQQLSFIPKLAVLWIALLVLPFAERTLLGAKTYYFSLYRARIGLRDVWANDPLHFLFLAAHKTRAGLRLDCVPTVVGLYMQRGHSSRGISNPRRPQGFERQLS